MQKEDLSIESFSAGAAEFDVVEELGVPELTENAVFQYQ
jgi:hypothetical protein